MAVYSVNASSSSSCPSPVRSKEKKRRSMTSKKSTSGSRTRRQERFFVGFLAVTGAAAFLFWLSPLAFHNNVNHHYHYRETKEQQEQQHKMMMSKESLSLRKGKGYNRKLVSVRPTDQQIRRAREFVAQSQERYASSETTINAQNKKKQHRHHHWSMRGIGWLWSHQQIVLTATFPPHITEPGKNMVEIWNVGDSIISECDKLTIWIRVAGPEIFAGSALPVQENEESCHWRFPFLLQKPGSYTVEAKVLLWNGKGRLQPQDCQTLSDFGSMAEMLSWPHDSLTGFKFYKPYKSCCEVCTRTPGCVQWSYPSLKKGELVGEGCELFYEEGMVEERDLTPASQLTKEASSSHRRLLEEPDQVDVLAPAHGAPRPNQDDASQFLGCGWSFHLSTDYPCLDPSVDDSVHTMHPNFTFETETPPAPKKLPYCALRDELHSRGRWVQLDWPNETACPVPFAMDEIFNEQFETTVHDGDHPECWFRDELMRVGQNCVEAGCQKLLPLAWMSSVKTNDRWYGQWQPYNCNYRQFTNEQLQQCITTKRISSIQTEGDSIARFLQQYLNQRLQDVIWYNKPNSLDIVLTTASVAHLLWDYDDEQGWKSVLQKRRVTVDGRTEYYYVSGFYYSSEREPNVQVERVYQLNRVLEKELAPRGYKLLQATDLTAAFAYDTATQMDGLHIIGPPMKMIITKLFHHICHGV